MAPGVPEVTVYEEDFDHQQRRQVLINFGHAQWGFNNWSWVVAKQELDFVELTNGKYYAGVVTFVTVTVKNLDIQRENMGYSMSNSSNKGLAISKARKYSVSNALRETLLSFGGTVAFELMELLEVQRIEIPVPVILSQSHSHTHTVPPAVPAPAPAPAASPAVVPAAARPCDAENNQNLPNKATEAKSTATKAAVKEETAPARSHQAAKNAPAAAANEARSPPVAKAHPMPATLRAGCSERAAAPAGRAHSRPNPNVSFVLQPVVGGMPVGAARLPGPQLGQPLFPNYYEYPWHFAYDQHHGNVNLNFNIPPKNLVVNSRAAAECRNACRPAAEGEPVQYAAAPPQNQGCWIKPTIFYDGFWTEQKVKKWVAEQVEKQFPEEVANTPAPATGAPAAPENAKA